MDERLRRAAREGNVSDLYALIQEDGNVLRRIDEVEFISTPLHIAADAGCIDFANEIMSLKPSFAKKLNPEGLSPIHVAVEKGHRELVLNLMENAIDLVRVKGKMGETPLHYVIAREDNAELLSRFLKDCPESTRDLTTKNQTALHIAVKNNKEKALKILCNKFRKTDYCEDVVNRKDRNGDTALHIAARDNRHKFRKQIVQKSSAIFHGLDNISGEDRNALLVILGLLLTATFQASLSPPGGVWQGDSSSNSTVTGGNDGKEPGESVMGQSEERNALLVILGLLLTATFQASLSPPGGVWQGDNDGKEPGKSVMDKSSFLLFYIPTSAVFIVTFFLTLGLLKPFPRGFRSSLQLLLAFLAICFYQSVLFLAPTDSAALVIHLSNWTVQRTLREDNLIADTLAKEEVRSTGLHGFAFESYPKGLIPMDHPSVWSIESRPPVKFGLWVSQIKKWSGGPGILSCSSSDVKKGSSAVHLIRLNL
ncbi:hypothetical protein PTKIN_Ptkin16aG0496800 [Pterospermum kingtungense]